ncbi:MAG: hypothetical protein IVW57_05595 [Ktedonobacterales bacterium]|nr:hypothetical protein [Ktedonobacterales bacterium]
MKKLTVFIFPLVAVGALLLAGCGKSAGGSGGTSSGPSFPQGTTIGMTASNFTQNSIGVKLNSPVSFDDTVNGGGYHIVCIGTGNGGGGAGTCAKSGDGPTQLYGAGVTFQGNNKMDITFPKAGTFHVICTVHPNMYIDVKAQ